jgi:hypothetical protein
MAFVCNEYERVNEDSLYFEKKLHPKKEAAEYM